MADVEFKDFSIEVKKVIDSLAPQVLEEVAGELETQVKRNNVVVTSQTKNSWTHTVKSSKDQHTATIGSPLQNAIWEEFGTGEYALEGNGRKGGWSYKDEQSHWHHTKGKKPRRPLHHAYASMKNAIIKHIQDVFKGGLS